MEISKKTEKKRRLRKYIFVFVVVWILFQYVFMCNIIPSGSMKETLDITDTVISFRLHRNDLQRYDIVVFTKPEDSEKLYIKRILGMPGETIVIRNGAVYADGLLLRSDFCPEIPNAEGDGIYPIPEGCYFLMGDNRNHSEDCRHWENGAIPADQIKAKALLVIWPLYDWRWLGNEG